MMGKTRRGLTAPDFCPCAETTVAPSRKVATEVRLMIAKPSGHAAEATEFFITKEMGGRDPHKIVLHRGSCANADTAKGGRHAATTH